MNRFFGRYTVDNIIADVRQKVDLLNGLAEFHRAERDAHMAVAAAKKQLVDAAHTEANRAESIAAKFLALIS